MNKTQTLHLAMSVDAQLGEDVAEIAAKLTAALIQHQGQFHHPKDIFNIGMIVVTELILMERLILKTKEDI